MNKHERHQLPASGSCPRCHCPLGSISVWMENTWYCCGACAGSDRCACGCKPELARGRSSDVYVPTRRMFASRHPNGLKTDSDAPQRSRAFPFAEPQRGR